MKHGSHGLVASIRRPGVIGRQDATFFGNEILNPAGIGFDYRASGRDLT